LNISVKLSVRVVVGVATPVTATTVALPTRCLRAVTVALKDLDEPSAEMDKLGDSGGVELLFLQEASAASMPSDKIRVFFIC